uniref:Peptidase C14 caspase domain-containing protein n=1 Tax=Streptomyces avermitilis TaxID=33903 RepID=A0A499V9P9_STRAX|nr:hypothetical protein SAVMC3_37720 [Streptomyces avermitilis]
MGTIHALLVGIDDYPSQTATPLRGAVTDVEEAARLVTELVGERADLLFLRDGEATVAAVEDAVVRQLGAAGPGDTALLWFSGHGTQQRATGADLLIEATGQNQALVCVDGPLLDKRLGALLERVAEGGAHVVAVLDCCYAGGGTRAGVLTPRFAPPSPDWDWGEGEGGAETGARAGISGRTSGPEGSSRRPAPVRPRRPVMCCSPPAVSTSSPSRATSAAGGWGRSRTHCSARCARRGPASATASCWPRPTPGCAAPGAVSSRCCTR